MTRYLAPMTGRHPAMAATPTDVDPCPYCGSVSEVQPITGTSPRVQAWSCAECGTNWATTVVNPQLYVDHLIRTVEQLDSARSVLRQVVMLADDADMITDQELRARLLTLARGAR